MVFWGYFSPEIKKKLDELLIDRGCDESNTGAITCKCFQNLSSEDDSDDDEEDKAEDILSKKEEEGQEEEVDYPVFKFYMRGALLEIGP